MKVKSEREVAQSCPTLSDPMDCSPPGIFHARVLEWGAIAFSDLVAQSCATLCDPVVYSSPGSSVYRIFQARLEWAATPVPGDLLNPEIKPTSLTPAALAGRLFTTAPPGKVDFRCEGC